MGRVLLCYISGFDLRRIDDQSTPFTAGAMQSHPWAHIVNLPSNELFPTLVTGTDPTEHGVWGVRLKPPAPRSVGATLVDQLPDGLATAVQGCLHLWGHGFDLAAIPPRRRRRFEITRTKYKRRTHRPEALFGIGGVPTVFDVIGGDRSRYLFYGGYDPERSLLPRLCMDSQRLEVVELYSLDRHQQWNLDRPEAVRPFYARIDRFLRILHEKCEASGWSLMIVSDHGHEPIRGSCDLQERLAGLDVPQEEYSYFLEVSCARFWFHTARARQRIGGILSNLEHASVAGFAEMGRFGIPLRNSSYGEVFVFLDPGHIFFPHDFHHPLANLWLGLTDRVQRSRLRDPRQRANHGHLPHFDTERSFLLLLDPRFRVTRDSGSVLDVAPSLLEVLGSEPPPTMRGRALFRRRAAGA